MNKLILSISLVLAISGCASQEYAQYSKAQSDIAIARQNSDVARYKAMADIAAAGDSNAKVAAVLAIALGQQTSTTTTSLQAPQTNQALQWASILVPSVMQAYAIGKSAEVAINSSNNATSTSIATTAGFVGMASKVQAPAANISTINTNTLSGTGVLGTGTYSTSVPIVVPDVIQITPVVVPDVIQVVPINAAPIL